MLKQLLQAGVILAGFAAMPSWAVSVDDDGVVGSIWTGTQSQNVANEIDWAQYLLDLGTSTSVTADGNDPLDGATEDYVTGINDYSGILTGGTQDDSGSLEGWTSYEFVLGKYNGQNAGSILFNVADYLAASGDALPGLSYPIWGDEGQYQLSHWTGFNAGDDDCNGDCDVPEPGILALLAIGLVGMGVARRRTRV